MVFIKINSLVLELIQVTDMSISQVACNRLCSRQLIGYQQMDNVLKQLAFLREDVQKQIDGIKNPKAPIFKGFTTVDMINKEGKDTEKTKEDQIKELEAELAKYDKYKQYRGMEDLQDKIEPAYMTSHLCNNVQEAACEKIKEKVKAEHAKGGISAEELEKKIDLACRMPIVKGHDKHQEENLRKINERYKETDE